MDYQTETREQTQLSEPDMMAVLVHKDDETEFDFLVLMLQEIFGRSEDDAIAGVEQIVLKGKTCAGVYTFEIAEEKQGEALTLANEYGFTKLRITLQIE